ncbi:hypothetical protein Syun_011156 [Stephania yunnanensis]|uniref:N-alpha-acetyltransferase 35, NatC auxiliary subunit n=1 Tax=Stephania yunnanensis TaxID=152371 RepID=A0AAP0JX04_9MAGN
MDPKMDSGIENCAYHSVEEAIENGVAPVPFSFDRTVDVQCTIDVMDHLLACEATWHKGNSLAQTVFSCIYLLRLERTSSHALLNSYCRIIRATCSAVISIVSDARTHEEEDIFTMAYGLPLKGEGDEKCLSMLNAVEETISRQLRACKAQSSKKRVSEDTEPLQTNPNLEEGYCKALLSRIRFRKHFYHVLMCMRKPHGRGLELARKHIASCQSELACILKSSEFLASNVRGGSQNDIEERTTASGCRSIGFDASLNSKLSAPTPPRAIKIVSWNKAIEYFEKLLNDLDIICSFSMDPLLENILCSVVQFQKCKPDLVARAHLQVLLVQDGKLYGRDLIFDVISKAAALPEITKNHETQKNEFLVPLGQIHVVRSSSSPHLEVQLRNLLHLPHLIVRYQQFCRVKPNTMITWTLMLVESNELLLVQNLGRLLESDLDEMSTVYGTLATVENMVEVREFDSNKQCALELLAISLQNSTVNQKSLGQINWLLINLLKILCTNLAWQRRKLGKILQDWAVTSVQLTMALNRELEENSNVYVDENVCMKLSKHLLIWAEEQTYWIAYRFLTLGFDLELYSPSEYCMVYWFIYCILVKLSEKAQLKMVASTDAVKRKGKKKKDISKDVLNDQKLSPAVLLLQCYICLSEGLTMMLAALRNEHDAFQMPIAFNTEEETLVKYNYFRDAQRIVKELRSSFSSDPDRLDELRQIEQIAEHNRVALNVICQAGASDTSLKVSFEFTHSPCFAIAVVKRS